MRLDGPLLLNGVRPEESCVKLNPVKNPLRKQETKCLLVTLTPVSEPDSQAVRLQLLNSALEPHSGLLATITSLASPPAWRTEGCCHLTDT